MAARRAAALTTAALVPIALLLGAAPAAATAGPPPSAVTTGRAPVPVAASWAAGPPTATEAETGGTGRDHAGATDAGKAALLAGTAVTGVVGALLLALVRRRATIGAGGAEKATTAACIAPVAPSGRHRPRPTDRRRTTPPTAPGETAAPTVVAACCRLTERGSTAGRTP